MNILIKLPLVLAENIAFGVFPGLRNLIERNVYNPYYFGDSYINYTKGQYKSLVKNVGDLKGKMLLELGPGGSVGLGLLAIKDGLQKYVAIDAEDHLNDKKAIQMYKQLLGINGVDGLMKKVEVMPLNNKYGYDLDDKSVDLIYSCAVLEHVKGIENCIKEMSRVLKKGGRMNHQVDLRDHVFSQKSLFFLSIPQKLFDIFFSNTGGWVNRTRWSQYKKLFDKYGLKIIKVNFDVEWEGVFPKYLLKKYSKDDIKKLSFNVILEKK